MDPRRTDTHEQDTGSCSFPAPTVAEACTAERATPFYVRRVESFMRNHLRDDIGIDDLVQASGVSRRSLHAGFRRYRSTTPLGMLKTLRMEAARNELKSAGTTHRTVTEIATNLGFFHLSNFAKDFRESFGMLPSQLLRSGSPPGCI